MLVCQLAVSSVTGVATLAGMQASLLWDYDGSEQLYCSNCMFTGQLIPGANPGVQSVVRLINTTVTCKTLSTWQDYIEGLNSTAEVSRCCFTDIAQSRSLCTEHGAWGT